MEQHPVPQPITSYEFRLVGDMTIKQFGKLSAGLILALIVYGINPPIALLKWFLIILFAGLGVIAAFVPFQGRPIDIWIVAFFKRIYSPTQFLWQPKNKKLPVTESITTAAKTTPPVQKQTAPPSPPQSSTTTLPKDSIYQTSLSAQGKKFFFPAPFPPQRGTGKRVDARFAPGIIIPATPSFPNIIVGFIHDKDKKIVDSAILEIRDSTGTPVRALKSNKLGQFQIATPLSNGSYEIEVEREGYSFDIIKINLEGKIIPPIEIISRG